MPAHVLEIANDGRYLFKDRGFIVVSAKGEKSEVGRFPLDNVLAVIANAHGLSYSNNLLVALAQRGIPFVLCGQNHNAVGHLLPIESHHLQAARFDAQIGASKPLRKRLWKTVVVAKIRQQAAVLVSTGGSDSRLLRLADKVRAGDPHNFEAQAAQYWPQLLGKHFRRNRAEAGINAMINYGATVLRAATARAIVGAGLHPTLGIHHSNQSNGMRLVDDLMEPFRPIVEHAVFTLFSEGKIEIDQSAKQTLVNSLYTDLSTTEGTTPLVVCLQRLAQSLAMVYTKQTNHLEFPAPWQPNANKLKDGG